MNHKFVTELKSLVYIYCFEFKIDHVCVKSARLEVAPG